MINGYIMAFFKIASLLTTVAHRRTQVMRMMKFSPSVITPVNVLNVVLYKISTNYSVIYQLILFYSFCDSFRLCFTNPLCMDRSAEPVLKHRIGQYCHLVEAGLKSNS